MTSGNFDAVLFDIGDTLIHFETWKARRYVDAAAVPAYEQLQEAGQRLPSLHRYARKLRWGFLRAFLWSRIVRREVRLIPLLCRVHQRMGIDLTEEHLADFVRECLPVVRQFFVTDPQARDMLGCLYESGMKLGIVSNTFFPRFAIDDVLRHEGLLEYFSACIYSSDVGFMKPHRRIFEPALEQLGVSASRTAFVGDRISKDIRGAARLGMTTILLRKSGHVPWYRFKPDHLVRCLSEIPHVLRIDHRDTEAQREEFKSAEPRRKSDK